MSDAVVKVQAPDVMTLGGVFARSGYFQDARDAAQAVVKMLAGQELGFGPVASMTGIYIVKGKVSLSANLMAAAVKRGKYNYRVVELSETACKIDFYEGKEKVGDSSFTMEDAKVAGLANEINYKKFPRNMLFARAMSNGAKWYCADIFGGPVYTPDELGAVVDGETGEMVERPKDEKILPPPPSAGPLFEPPPETTDAQAARLFKTPAEEEREEKLAVLERVAKGFMACQLSGNEQNAKWLKHSGGQGPFLDVDVITLDGLTALHEELTTLYQAKKSREKK